MNNLFKVSSNKVRPWGAVFITISMLLNTMFWLVVFGDSLSQGVSDILSGWYFLFSALITYGCWYGRNWAWALVIINGVIGLVRDSGVKIESPGLEDVGSYVVAIVLILTLVVTFLPKTKAFYIADKGKINQLSVSPKRLIKILLIFIVAPIVFFILFGVVVTLLDM